MRFFRDVVIALFLSFLPLSCARPEVHVHDRHGLSFPIVESYAKKRPGATLILLDYHHDVGPFDREVLSSNWVGKLLAEKKVDRVLWVSGRDLMRPNREARIAWLRRSLSVLPPAAAALIEDRLALVDWRDLEAQRIEGPVAVSLDFDIFCHDSGDPPERFLDEIAAWISRQRPGLLTLALSAAYQEGAGASWSRLERFAASYGVKSSSWFLEVGTPTRKPEGAEEATAWRRWAADREVFGLRGAGFLPGSAMWIAPPPTLRGTLVARGTRPGDEAAKGILEGWRDPDVLALERAYPNAATDGLLATAADTLENYWGIKAASSASATSQPLSPPSSADGAFGPEPVGIALRVLGRYGDRGCLALPRGVVDLTGAAAFCALGAVRDSRYPPVEERERESIELELSVFGPWRAMENPFDFRPGLDSLLLHKETETTLLQASVAAERCYDRPEFLQRLSIKAGLGPEGWRNGGLRFERAATIWSRQGLLSVEEAMGYQKKEKK